MKFFRKYYEDVCKRRQEELSRLYTENLSTSYRWQDILKDALEANK